MTNRTRYAHVRYQYERIVRVKITDELAVLYQEQSFARDSPTPALDVDSAIEAAAHPASILFPSHVPEEGLSAVDYSITIVPSV